MVVPEDCWLFQNHSARPSLTINCLSMPLRQGQQNVSPSFIYYSTFSQDVAFPGSGVPGLGGLAQANGADRLIQFLPPQFDVKDGPPALHDGHGVKATSNAVSGSTPKRFGILYQSGNQTGMLFSPLCYPAQNPIVPPSLGTCNLCDEGKAVNIEKWFPTKATIQEKTEENGIIGERSEMREDTNEINALLYSDDDDDDDGGGYDCDEEDEVKSTDRSPFVFEGCYKKREYEEEITAELANAESLMKRQRFIDGGYKKSFVKLEAESSCAKCRNQGEDSISLFGNKQSRKDKIREKLKILESLIPGVKSKNPSLVIDEAISYMKYLKLKAKAAGVSYPPFQQ